jgi:genome maintenance exonuclease 1
MEYQYEDFSAQTEKKGRIYHSPGGDLPSITTILNKTRDNTWLYAWRKRVGEEKANEIATAAATRGTKIHKHMENHMDGKEVDLSEASEDEVQMFNGLKLYESKITKVYGKEIALYSKSLKFAGRADLIGEWENIPAIVDYKTSRKPKRKSWIKDYFIQGTAYALAHDEMYDTQINLIVVLITVENDIPQCFTLNLKEESWPIDALGARLVEFYKQFPGGKI